MRFLIAIQEVSGHWKKKGIVERKSRCSPDSDIKRFFPPGTRVYTEVLKSCRFLAADPAANFVDWRSKMRHRDYLIRTIKLND